MWITDSKPGCSHFFSESLSDAFSKQAAISSQCESFAVRLCLRKDHRPTERRLPPHLVPVTIRLHHRTSQLLKRAYLEQKLKHAKPDTLQEIGEEAIADWLFRAGYLD
jgi:hypothetical protein